MRRFFLFCGGLLILLFPWNSAQSRDDKPLPPELVAPTGPRSPEAERSGFHVPPGFEVQLVASDPDIHKPMNIAFDDRGRLWLTETVEYPFPAAAGTKPRDTVKVLEDIGPDGKARKITTFADGLNIPIGLLPMPGGREALVHSIPSIDRVTDTDGDGKADKREVAYKTYGSRDTHGMTNAFTWGVDGWIYACHGFSNSSQVAGKDGKAMTLNSGNTYRMKADGSHVEQFTHGQVNPFGLCFDALGNLFSADCHSKPIYHLVRNGWYPTFGPQNDGLGFAPQMITHDHGSTAISGVVYYAGDGFPAEWQGNAFIGNVVTNRINRDTVEWKGSTPKGILQPDFLSSDDPWFRPVDLKLGPDGALYIADFYNKIIGHYEVPLTHPGRDRERGRVWRIVYRGTDGKGEVPKIPDFTRMEISDLVHELAAPNLARRVFATNQLVIRGGKEVIERVRADAVMSANATARVHGLWILERLGSLDEATLTTALTEPDREVRVHARKIVGGRANPAGESLTLVRDGLKDPDPFVRRASADALGLHADAANVRVLLDARHAAKGEDEALAYVIRVSLRDQFLTRAAWPVLTGENGYSAEDLRVLADVARGTPSRESARFVVAYLARYPEERGLMMDHLHHVARHGDTATDGPLLSFAAAHHPDDLGLQAEMVKAVHRGLQERGAPLIGLALKWSSGVAGKLLKTERPETIAQGIELTESLRLGANREAIVAIALAPGRPESLRITAINALGSLDPATAAEPLGRILTDLAAPFAMREAAVIAMGKTNQDSARTRLLDAFPIAPDRLQTTIAAALASSRPGAEALLTAVTGGKASARLLQERSVRIWLDQANIPDLAERITRLTAGLAPSDAKLAQLLDHRRSALVTAKADGTRGEAVYKKNCAICHQIGGQGAKIGPQLDGIGARGGDRLVEDILDPNRNIDQAFRLTTLALKDGRVLSGLLLREEGDVLILADAQGKEQRITKDSVEARKVSPLSPMPADFAEKIADAEFFDLMAYLLAVKAK
ncbi:MAG: putative rane-bound dehydrogenase [Planctomycetota bacterium]|nr:putative rane-bound dehydrogenase [Planctomycetota bacterium]